MKTAVLADLHMTDKFDTVKLPVLDWTLRELKNTASGSCSGGKNSPPI